LGQQLAELCQVSFGMTLAQEHRQVRAEPGKVAVATKGACPQGPAHMGDDLGNGLFYLGAQTSDWQAGIDTRLRINPVCTLA